MKTMMISKSLRKEDRCGFLIEKHETLVYSEIKQITGSRGHVT